MAPITYTVDMVLQAHVKGVLDAVVNVLVVEITDIFRKCIALEQRDAYHAGSYVGFTDPAEVQHRLRKSLNNIRQSGPSPGCDKQLSTAMSKTRPPSGSKQASVPVLPECSSAHSMDTTDSTVMPDLPVFIEMFAGDAHVLLSELNSNQEVQTVQCGSLKQESQDPPVPAQAEVKMTPQKALPPQKKQASEEQVFHSGSEEESSLANSSTPPTEGSSSSVCVFSLEMDVDAIPAIPHMCEGKEANEAKMVDRTPPQSTPPESRLLSPTESGKSPGASCDAVKEGVKEVTKGQEEMNNEMKEEEEEVTEKNDGSSDSQPCTSVLSPSHTTQRLSGPIAEDAGAEQSGQRTGDDDDGENAPHPSDCPSLQPVSLPLPSCSVQLNRLSPRWTQKQRTLLVCPDCPRVFRSLKSLCKHRRFHSGETPFHCPQCPRKFILRKNMRRHLRRHTGEKPYRCPQCSKAFRVRKTLDKHIRVRHMT